MDFPRFNYAASIHGVFSEGGGERLSKRIRRRLSLALVINPLVSKRGGTKKEMLGSGRDGLPKIVCSFDIIKQQFSGQL